MSGPIPLSTDETQGYMDTYYSTTHWPPTFARQPGGTVCPAAISGHTRRRRHEGAPVQVVLPVPSAVTLRRSPIHARQRSYLGLQKRRKKTFHSVIT